MKLSDQKIFLSEKKKKRFLKSNYNRDKGPRVEFYLEGNEISKLQEKLMKAYQYEGLSGWDMSFLDSTIEKMVKSSNNIYICTEKQKEHIERLSAIYIHSLSSIEEREREEKKLQKEGPGFFFKKVEK